MEKLPDIHGNKLLLTICEDILRGVLDENENIRRLDPIKCITILRYMAILKRMDKLRNEFRKTDLVTYVEFMKETAVTEEIGYFLLKNLRGYMHINEKTQINAILNNIKIEIMRLKNQCTAKLGFECDLTREEVYELLSGYMGKLADDSPYLAIYPAKVIDARKIFEAKQKNVTK